ncbi:MAG TPA: hypothetical protein VMR33_18430 [Candidatus Baltobacteraceae bacterium]|jgi:hypothetical protein|nr:hypothetical protein [Candidatus Baltobacteraceae bacterium]
MIRGQSPLCVLCGNSHLAVLLLQVFSKVNASGQNASCENNLKQIGLGLGHLTQVHMNTILQVQQPMNATILNYPGFQTLPKGIKQMLVASEAHFFDQPSTHHKGQKVGAQEMSVNHRFKVVFQKNTECSPALTHSVKLLCTLVSTFNHVPRQIV